MICFLKSRLGIYFYTLLTLSIYQKIYTNNSFINSRATSQYIIVGRVGIDPVDLRLLCFYARPYHSTEQKTGINIYINKKWLVDLLFYKQFLAEQHLESKATQTSKNSFSTPTNLLSKVNKLGGKYNHTGVKYNHTAHYLGNFLSLSCS